MQHATQLDNSLRGYGAGGARGCVHEADDKQYMQEVTVNYQWHEKRDKVEHAQNYGFSSYCRKAEYDGADEDGVQKIKSCAEHFGQFMGGNRSFPVIEILDDRRYRLWNNQEGEVWVYDDQQQKIQIKRNLILSRSQYKIVHRVIKDEEQADKKKSRDQSNQDIDDAQDGQQQQQPPDQGGETGKSGVEQGKPEQKPWKPLSTYAADKDSVVLIRQKDNDDGDWLSKIWMTNGNGDATPKGKKQKPKKEFLLEQKFDESKQSMVWTFYDQNEEPCLVLSIDGMYDFIQLQTLDGGEPQQTVKLDSNKDMITLVSKEVGVQVGPTKTYIGNAFDPNAVIAPFPAAKLGSIDSKGHRIISNTAQFVNVQ